MMSFVKMVVFFYMDIQDRQDLVRLCFTTVDAGVYRFLVVTGVLEPQIDTNEHEWIWEGMS